MKLLMMFALLSTSVFAQEEDLSKAKEHMISSLDKRIALMQETKACVSAAANKEALKACKSQWKEKRQALKEEMKSKRQGWKKERKEKKRS